MQAAGAAAAGPAVLQELSLGTLLARREALLRLVDPAALGDFRWLAFRRGPASALADPALPLFLREPPLA